MEYVSTFNLREGAPQSAAGLEKIQALAAELHKIRLSVVAAEPAVNELRHVVCSKSADRLLGTLDSIGAELADAAAHLHRLLASAGLTVQSKISDGVEREIAAKAAIARHEDLIGRPAPDGTASATPSDSCAYDKAASDSKKTNNSSDENPGNLNKVLDALSKKKKNSSNNESPGDLNKILDALNKKKKKNTDGGGAGGSGGL